MIEKENLKAIVILNSLTDSMLDKLIPIIDILKYEDRDVVFREGDPAERFYMLAQGKVILEQRIADKITVSMGSIRPGYSFGWSSMLSEGSFTSDAICAENSDVFSVRAQKLNNLLNNDHSMGYLINQKLLQIMKNRLQNRNEQFLNAIKNHPDIKALL